MAKRIYARSTRDYQNRITKQLEAEADRILNQMREQFARELKQQLADAIQNNDSASSGSDNGGSGFSACGRDGGTASSHARTRGRE